MNSKNNLYTLSDIDIHILEFVLQQDHVTKEELRNNFSTIIDSLDVRIHLLLTRKPPFLREKYDYNDDANTQYQHYYRITDHGRKALQDYKSNHKKEIFYLWLKNLWIPIIVSLITNLVIIGITLLL